MAIQKQDGAFTDARPSGADLTGKEMYLCKDDGNGNAVLCTNEAIVLGVIQEGRATGLWSSFAFGGILRVVASGAISAGAKVAAAADGKVKAGTTNSFGVCRKDVAVDGEIAEIYFDQN
jgi:hypothetical protein